MAKAVVSMLDVDPATIRIPHSFVYAGHTGVQAVVYDPGNTNGKCASPSPNNGLVYTIQPSAVALQMYDVMYGQGNTMTISNDDRGSETFIVGEEALREPSNVARIGSLQERFDSGPSILRAQALNAIFHTLMQKTQSNRYTATILLGVTLPIEDFYNPTAKDNLKEKFADLLKGRWRIENGRGVLTVTIIGIVPLPQTYGAIMAYCADPQGRLISQRTDMRYTALDLGAQMHLGRSVGTRQFTGEYIGKGMLLTASLLQTALEQQKIRVTIHQAIHALHTGLVPDGGGMRDVKPTVKSVISKATEAQLNEAVNRFVSHLSQSQGLIVGGGAIHYGEAVISRLPEEFQDKTIVVGNPQYATVFGSLLLLLAHVAKQNTTQGSPA